MAGTRQPRNGHERGDVALRRSQKDRPTAREQVKKKEEERKPEEGARSERTRHKREEEPRAWSRPHPTDALRHGREEAHEDNLTHTKNRQREEDAKTRHQTRASGRRRHAVDALALALALDTRTAVPRAEAVTERTIALASNHPNATAQRRHRCHACEQATRRSDADTDTNRRTNKEHSRADDERRWCQPCVRHAACGRRQAACGACIVKARDGTSDTNKIQ